MPKKNVSVRITTMDAELEFAIQSTTTGKQLFDQVVRTIGLREIWFFGLQYVDSKGFTTWLNLAKKVLQQMGSKYDTPLQFKFRAKFYPEEVTEEIIQDITLRMFYLQVKNTILSDEVYCPPETAVLLSSYAVQAKYSDFQPSVHLPGFLANDRLLPQRVLDQFKLTREAWEEKITKWYKEHKGLLREEAMMEYMKVAQDLEMYGINYFEIQNKKGTDVTLGIDALGINVYDRQNRLTPKIGFPWSEIRNITFHNKKFLIQPVDKKSPNFVFIASNVRVNKIILALCMGNHDLYVRRRKADTIEVQQMKIQAIEEKEAKKAANQKLAREVSMREEAEKKQKEFEEQLESMKRETDMRRKELHQAQSTIALLEQQLRELREAKEKLEVKQRELEVIMKQLEDTKKTETAERLRLQLEIREKQEEVDRITTEVTERDEEARKLQPLLTTDPLIILPHNQEEVEEARRKEEEATLALLQASSAVRRASSSSSSSSSSESEDEGEKIKIAEEIKYQAHRVTETAVQQSAYNDRMYENSRSMSPSSMGSSLSGSRSTTPSIHLETVTDTKGIEDRKEDSTTVRRMKLLEEVKLSLLADQIPEEMSTLDRIYNKNLMEGMSKYKTLREVRKGNTKRRVDQFENW
ncbi:hypothetical protein Pmani_035152 [Petrolisthes manimaculis]|uniref:Moesin/ezrin/radixin homolog 1 n=1 Tax=Petrolisthes manimaculis TaxID=1843537 RepID=A0AAE1TQT3_9EUCA|nr:hypothetical protein Pmani_035152 [Petrolisthes manimaculis]